jgi:hypothetical protein
MSSEFMEGDMSALRVIDIPDERPALSFELPDTTRRLGWIYYIGCMETHRLKIGFTAGDPHKRLDKLQTGSPTRLVLLGLDVGTSATERALHARFSNERVRGEWFRVSENLFEHLEYVARGCRGSGDGERLLCFARIALGRE